MINLNRALEELNILGYCKLGKVLDEANIIKMKDILYQEKVSDIKKHGIESLIKLNELETVRDLCRVSNLFIDLIAIDKLNLFIDTALNDRAVIYSYNGIISSPKEISKNFLGFEFHRDSQFFNGIRTALVVLLPLVDTNSTNGATIVCPGTHVFSSKPTTHFLDKNSISINCCAGEAYCIDGALWHKGGINISNGDRPVIALKYTLAPFKQQIDYCKSNSNVDEFPEIVKKRLGWYARTCENLDEYRVPGVERKFKTGNYEMGNTNIFYPQIIEKFQDN